MCDKKIILIILRRNLGPLLLGQDVPSCVHSAVCQSSVWQVSGGVEDGSPLCEKGPCSALCGLGPTEALLEGRQLPAFLEQSHH